MKITISNNTDSAITVYYPQHPNGIVRKCGEKVETAYTDRIFTFVRGDLVMKAHLYHGHYKVTNQGVIGGKKSYGTWVADPSKVFYELFRMTPDRPFMV